MIKNSVFLVFVVIFLSSCVAKRPIVETDTLGLIIRSPYIKTSGNGFYRKGDNYVNLQLYMAGKLVINYESNTLTCINEKCMTKTIFNKNVFVEPHYGNIMNDILKSQPIYDAKNLEKTAFGFIQEIAKEDKYDINYEVKENTTTFVDTINNVYIKIIRN
ncbi:MAG: hypothetical protein LBG67_05105 [Campylobacteraceae bacterium]|jgi:hypothetical protein|nr:hypothetical protein [Campylobacteraceae bacterium]